MALTWELIALEVVATLPHAQMAHGQVLKASIEVFILAILSCFLLFFRLETPRNLK